MTDTETDKLLTVPEVAERLRLSTETIRRMLRDGRLTGFRIGADNAGWRVSEADLVAFIRERRQGSKEDRNG
jgi:excisionase family DNA binding protein